MTRTLSAFTAVMLAAHAGMSQTSGSPATPPHGVKLVEFFQSDAPLTVTLTTNIKRLEHDHPDKGHAAWRFATLTYTGDNGAAVTVPLRVRTRGIWRHQNCDFPPLRLKFSGAASKHTIFHRLEKPKLINYCRDEDTYEGYILKEYQLYRVYHLLTPASHAVRLLRMTYVDSASGKTRAVRYAFVEEDPAAMAQRLQGRLLKIKGATPDDLEPVHDATVGLFQYMIGNTDFSLSALHNAELFAAADGEYWPIVYDFDFAGAVNAKYATTDSRLNLRSVRDRRYRGYCVPLDIYPRVFALFNAKKDSIYALYHDSIGKLMSPNDVAETLRYFDDFYTTINDPQSVTEDITDSCLGTKPTG